MPAETSGPVESPSLDAELALIDSETESDDEGQAGPNLEKQQEEDPGRTNAESEVQSPTASTTYSTVMTTTIIPPPPPQPQQSTVNPTLMKCIDKREQHMVNLIQYNLDLKERLDKHGSRLYKLENLNIPHQEILQQWMFESKSYEAHEDHKKLYDAIEKTLEHDYSDQLLSDLEEGRQKKRKRRDVPRTPSGLPPPHPPPPPPLAGASGAPDVENNWATVLASTYVTPAENSLLAKIGDMTNFLNWYCRQVNKTKLTQAYLEGQAYEVVKAFYPIVSNLQFQMEECHKLLTDQVDWTNPEGDHVRIDVN
nr:hypothetical protein [Tanacetum cinerariifolium]